MESEYRPYTVTKTNQRAKIYPDAERQIPEEGILLKAGGRVFKITPKALRTYANEYGLGQSNAPLDMQQCLAHITEELEEALKGTPKPTYTRSRIVALESPSLVFKMVGSKIMNIRISLKYTQGRKGKGLDDKLYGASESVE